MNPRDFLTAARRLLASTEEADWRSAVRRAYYALFHVACRRMTGLGFVVPRGEQAHGYLWLRLQNCGETTVEAAGRDLNNLRRQRNQADYDLTRSFNQSHAHTLVRLAERTILILDAVVEPTRTQLITAMRLYEQNVLKDVTWHP